MRSDQCCVVYQAGVFNSGPGDLLSCRVDLQS